MQQDFVYDPQIFGFRDYIYCSNCEARIAHVKDYIPNVHDLDYGGYFNRVFNVVVLDQPKFYQQEDGNILTRLNTYCDQCNVLLGWRLRDATLRSEYFITGRFFMRLDKLMYQNRVTLHNSLFGGEKGQDHVQDGGANDQPLLYFNEEQVGDANEEGPNDENGGANEQSADQDGDATSSFMIKLKALVNRILNKMHSRQ
ncbi:uncharacterized protein LOC129901118 [Solanum dulcamara]|uniref:uncharacterized protein LOC129901118 n=1 Tax=Solanum dulcamara TaxID=45834 RepID=UPI00248536E9|nr:uncharacterized protein LOC129901118 [Solanum dulcamara]